MAARAPGSRCGWGRGGDRNIRCNHRWRCPTWRQMGCDEVRRSGSDLSTAPLDEELSCRVSHVFWLKVCVPGALNERVGAYREGAWTRSTTAIGISAYSPHGSGAIFGRSDAAVGGWPSADGLRVRMASVAAARAVACAVSHGFGASPAAVEAISESAGRRSASHVVRRRLLKADCRAFAGRSLGGCTKGSSRARATYWCGEVGDTCYFVCLSACEMIMTRLSS